MAGNPFESLLSAGDDFDPASWHRGSSRVPIEGASILSTPSRGPARLAGRRWLKSPAMATACSSSMQESRCRIASYNVLAKCYAKARHFTRCKPEYLRWDVRRKALMEVVRELDADILCLQEVDNYLHFWVKELQLLGYTGCYKQRNADSKNDGCATFFRTSKFEKVCHDSIEFDRVPDEGGKRPDFATHNVALLVLLRPTNFSHESCICVANAHLFWDPMYEDVKLAQARALVKAAEDMVKASNVDAASTPVILAGDFNSMPGSDVYNFLTRDAAFRSSYVACGGSPQQSPNPSPHMSPQHMSPQQSPYPSPSQGPNIFNLPPSSFGSPGSGKINPNSPPFSPQVMGKLLFNKPLNPDSPSFSPGGSPVPSPARHQTSFGLLRSGLPTHLEDPDTYEGVGYLDDDDVEEDYSWGAGDGSNRREEGTAPGEEPKFTNYRDIFKGTLDYIFFRQEALLQGSENQGARVLVDKCLAMISEGEAKRQGGGLPNNKHPSDHLPIAVDVLLHLPSA